MAISQFTKRNLLDLREAVEQALKGVEKQFGVRIRFGGGKFSEVKYTGKMIIEVADKNLVTDYEKKLWDEFSRYFGFKPEHLGQEFMFDGYRFQIMGIKPNRKKFPIMAERLPDKMKYKFPASTVRQAMGIPHGTHLF